MKYMAGKIQKSYQIYIHSIAFLYTKCNLLQSSGDRIAATEIVIKRINK